MSDPVEALPSVDVLEQPVSLSPTQPLLLREAREAVGMHLAAVAVALKVPVSRLEALESGRYHELPDPTFARALAKSVCKLLKVDPLPILATMPSAPQADLGPSVTSIRQPMPLSHSGKMMSASESMVRMPSAVFFALILFILAVFLWLWLPERQVVEAVQPVSMGSNPEPLAAAIVAVPPSEVPVSPHDAGAAPTALPQIVSPSQAIEVTTTVQSELPPGLVRVSASDTVWLQVVGASGRVLLQRSLGPQETVGFSNDLPISVVVGRADQVKVFVRGQAFDLDPWTRANVARFEVQ